MTLLRHTQVHRCPICDGADRDERGVGKRCSGFTSGDGGWANCSREEHAGSLLINANSGTYGHRLSGQCECGNEHNPDPAIDRVYDYSDESGHLLFQVVRKKGKKFVQRKPDGSGGWVWSTRDVRRVLFRLPELLAADAGATVFVVEGEKDVLTLVTNGAVATTNPGGAGKWSFVADLAQKVLAGRDVVVVADADDVGRAHARQVGESLTAVARSLRLTECPPPYKDVSDFLRAGGKLEDLIRLHAPAATASSPSSASSGGSDDESDADDKKPPKLAEQVANVVEQHVDLFHDANEIGWAVLPTGKRGACVRLGSRMMRSWISRIARTDLGTAPTPATIDAALVILDAIARFDRDERVVFLRVAEQNGEIYVDLGDETGACVAITSRGWDVIEIAPVMFRRPQAMRPLPRPTRGGSMQELKPFLNVDDDGLHQITAWCVGAFCPRLPCAALAMTGEQGTAKSTVARVVRLLVDPNAAPLRTVPRTEDDLAVSAQHSHVVAYDNLSGLPPWLSDALCRLITGGGLSKRTLYSDDEETVLDAIRPVIINGIDDLANRADLAERCIMLTLKPIADEKRRDEKTFWRDFEGARPRILGALLDGVASALANIDTVKVDRLPRMADFARWITAAAPGLGLARNTLLDAYRKSTEHAVQVALEASPVATAMLAMLDAQRGGQYSGTSTELLVALSVHVSESVRFSRQWPVDGYGLSTRIRRSASFLRRSGVEMSESRTARARLWTFKRAPSAAGGNGPLFVTREVPASEEPPLASSASSVSLDEGRECDGGDADDAVIGAGRAHVVAPTSLAADVPGAQGKSSEAHLLSFAAKDEARGLANGALVTIETRSVPETPGG